MSIRDFILVSMLAVPVTAFAGDPHSYADTDTVRVRAAALDLKVDFADRRLAGNVRLDLDWKKPDQHALVLDTRDLEIERVFAIDAKGKEKAARFSLDKRDPIFGSALRIDLPEAAPAVRIHYRTAPTASGLQWMTPEQTAGKKRSFMYSQSQAIHARSWVPLQDTPSVRFTYTAQIAAPKGYRVLMSADNDAAHPLNGQFRFAMKQPIPSYLLAIAVGDLAVRETGRRTAVYAEASVVQSAAKEFEDTESMIEAAEKLYGPYRWERYDILVLPASFPFGGMENPRITFATPTVIAGDKSLVGLIAHELAHSWSGNLVTNANWQHMWLNEGFTTYVENRIVEAVYGKDEAVMQLVVDDGEVREEMAEMSDNAQLLVPDLNGVDPDEGLSGVPYNKGRWFLRFLELRYGREAFDPFLRGYFDHFAFQSIDTDQFLAYYEAHLAKPHPGKVSRAEIDAWLHKPGIPADAPVSRSPRFDAVDTARTEWLAGKRKADALGADAWVTYEWLHFLNGLPATLPVEQLQALDTAWKLTGTGNAEVAFRWYALTIRSGYVQARPAIAAFVERIGRRKLVLPLYEALAKTADGKAFARQVYAKAKPGYHPLTQGSVERVLAD